MEYFRYNKDELEIMAQKNRYMGEGDKYRLAKSAGFEAMPNYEAIKNLYQNYGANPTDEDIKEAIKIMDNTGFNPALLQEWERYLEEVEGFSRVYKVTDLKLNKLSKTDASTNAILEKAKSMIREVEASGILKR